MQTATAPANNPTAPTAPIPPSTAALFASGCGGLHPGEDLREYVLRPVELRLVRLLPRRARARHSGAQHGVVVVLCGGVVENVEEGEEERCLAGARGALRQEGVVGIAW